MLKRRSVMRRTKEDSEETKRKIIDAAVELFENQGFVATRIQDIADKMGMSRGAVYWHFKNKDELFMSIFTNFGHRLERLLTESLHHTDSPLQQLRWLLVNIISSPDILVGFRQMRMIAVSEFTNSGEPNSCQKQGKKYMDKYFSVIESILQSGIEAGEIRSDVNPNNATWLIIFFVVGAVNIHLKNPTLTPLKGDVAGIVDLFLQGIVR
jgi:TetR/AcrR family acrAB operon transcriptional repressor